LRRCALKLSFFGDILLIQDIMRKKAIRLRCWIELDGTKFFGPGPAQLLELIESEGSLAKAAKKMKMSYKKAWDMIDDINSRGKKPFVLLRKGGEKGGGAELTATGKKVVSRYHRLTARLNTVVEKDNELLKLI
jgi:molybdate transport system regulatory protein